MLFIPGPVDLTDEIRTSQSVKMINHRAKEYQDLHSSIVQNFRSLLDCDDVFILTASGTGGIEAALANTISKNTKVLCLSNGIFGKRLAEAAQIYSDKVTEEKIEYGKGFAIELVRDIIDRSGAEILAMVYNETSLGVVNEIKNICSYAKSKGMFVIIDAISAFAGHELKMREWGIDVVIVGSQKCLGAPPGLSILGVSKNAIERIKNNDTRTYYFDLKKYIKFQEKNETPFTPAVSLMFALKKALDGLLKEGIDKRIERHKRAGEILRRSIKESGLQLFAQEGFESNTVTSFAAENGDMIKGELRRRYDFEIAGGMEDMKGKLWRLGHLGNFKDEDIFSLAGAIKEIKK